MTNHQNVVFPLPGDGEWPPVRIERVRCALVAGDRARLLDPPRFADGVSRGDTVTVTEEGGELVAGDIVETAGHSTVRAVIADPAELAVVADRLRAVGADVTVETVEPAESVQALEAARSVEAREVGMLVVDIPPHASLARVRRVLDNARGPLADYAVGCEQHESADLKALAGELTGRLALPGDEDWDTVRAAWNLSLDQRPDAVAFPADAGDVAAVLSFATAHGLRVAPQSGAHNAGPLGDLTGVILLRMTGLSTVRVDVPGRRVHVGGGALWGQVIGALTGTGLAALAGSSADVGVAGYLLGGGYSWLGRKYGLGANSIRSAEVVTVDGRIRTVDAASEPELFWALRGGHGTSMVVTEFELEVFEVDIVHAGALLFPLERAREILEAYEAWITEVAEHDDSVTSCVRLLRMPPLPELPEFLRGQAFVAVDGAITADARHADELLRPLRTLGPAVDMWGPMPATELAGIHLDPPMPTPAAGGGLSLDALPIEAMLAAAGPDADTALLAVDIRHLGGALARPVAGGGAVDHLPGRFLAFAVGVTPDAATHRRVSAEVDALLHAMRPWAAERTYANFSESRQRPESFHSPEVLWRLIEVQDQYDPERVVLSNHAIR